MLSSPVVALFVWAFLAYGLSLVNIEWGYILPLPPFGNPVRHFFSILYLAGLLLALMQTARAAAHITEQATPTVRAVLLLAGTVLSLPTLATVIAGATRATNPLLTALPNLLNLLPPFAQMVWTIFVASVALSLLGANIGRVIKHPNTLLAGAGFSVFFDIVVVTMGTVAQVMQKNSGLIAAASIGAGASATTAGTPPGVVRHGPALIPPLCTVTIGPADVLFLALFLGAVILLRLNSRATFAWMYLLLFAALVLVETVGLPIPALAPMGIAVLIANARHAAFTRDEKYALVYGGGFAVLCAVGIIWGAQRFVRAEPPRFGFVKGQRKNTDPWVTMGIYPGSPAQKAGLLPGDLILRVNDLPTQTLTNEQFDDERRSALQTGTLTLTVQRSGEKKPRVLLLHPAVAPARW